MGLRLRAKIKNKIWRPVIRRWGVPGGVILIGLPLALIIGGGGAYALFLGGSSGQTSTSPINLSKGLVGWWKMNGNAKDSTPYADNGTVTSATLTTDQEGQANKAYSFNGTTSSINVPLALTAGTSISTSAWIYLNGTPPTNAAVISAVSATNYGTLSMILQGSELFVGLTNTTGGWQYNHSASGSVVPGNWYHVVGWINQSTQQYGLYINGQSIFTSSFTGTLEAASSFNIGLFGYQNVHFNGSIDDVRMYSRVLSSAEVKALYNQYNPSLKTDSGENGLVGWWKMDGNAKDSTPYANNGTLYNSPSLTTDREGNANKAYSFNGTNQWLRLPNNTALDPGNGSATWSEWFNSSYTGGAQFLYRKSDSCGANGLILESNSPSAGKIEGFLETSAGCSGGTVVSVASPGTYSDGKWHLATVSLDRSNNTLNLYMDGQSVASSSASALVGDNLVSANYPSIASSYGGADFFNGSLDDMRVYNRALSASDVTNLYNSYNSQINIGGSGASGGVNLYRGLMGYWPFSGNAKDSTPYGNNGTVTNATLTTDRFGNSNSAYSFNGSNSYIGLNTMSIANSISVSAWVYSTNYSQNGFIVGKNPVNTQWELFFSTGGLYWRGGNTASVICSLPSNSTWHHVVGVQTGTTATLYIDGSQCATGTVAAINNGTDTVEIGRFRGGYYFNGSIDDVRIYNRVLSASEVQALYTQSY